MEMLHCQYKLPNDFTFTTFPDIEAQNSHPFGFALHVLMLFGPFVLNHCVGGDRFHRKSDVFSSCVTLTGDCTMCRLNSLLTGQRKVSYRGQ